MTHLRHKGMEGAAFAPGVAAGGLIFVTGMTGSGPDGGMPEGIAAQTHTALDKIALVLGEAGAALPDVVDILSFHIGLRDHFAEVEAILAERLSAPAWTATEAPLLRRAGALIELRAVASAPAPAQ